MEILKTSVCGNNKSKAKCRFICIIYCLIYSLAVSAWDAPNNVTKTITIQVGEYALLNPRGAIRGLSDYQISGAGYGNNNGIGTGLTITVSSTKNVRNTSLNKICHYYTYKVQANKVGTYNLQTWVSYYYDDLTTINTGSVKVDYTINVVDVTSIEMPNSLSLKIGDEYQLSPILSPQGAKSKLTWTTQNNDVVSVTNGLVTAKSCGTTVVKCIASNGVSAQCIVTVNPINVETITLNHSEFDIITNQKEQLTATILPANATNKKIKWSSSNDGVALVGDNGLVKAVSPGHAKITATALDGSGVSASCFFNVSAPIISAQSINFVESNVDVEIDESKPLIVKILPDNTTNKKLEWRSSNPECATVSDDGVIKGVSVGNVEITATTIDGSNLSTTCMVSVKPQSVGSFDNIIYFNTTKIVANSSATIPLYLNNKNAITAIQFDLVLPKGITVGDNVTINTKDNRTTDGVHTVAKSVLDDGTIRVLCYSPSLATFEGESGAILNIPLNISEDIAVGKYYILFNNIIMTEKDGVKHTVDKYASVVEITDAINGDSNGDGSVDVADIVVVANYILGNTPANFIESAADVNGDGTIDVADIVSLANLLLHPQEMNAAKNKIARSGEVESRVDALKVMPFTASIGEKSKIVTLDLFNTIEDFTAFQCDLYLPEGVTLNKNKRGTAYNISFNSDEERTDASCHTLSAAQQKDGAIRIICYSVNNDIFTGLEGAIVNLPLSTDNSIEAGAYNYCLKNVVITRTDGTKVCPSAYNGTIIIGDGGNDPYITMHGDYTVDNLAEFSKALSTNKAILSIDMTGAESVESNVAFNTANPNTIIFLAKSHSLANENNVVVDGVCSNLKLTDGFDYGCQLGFVADKIEYNRMMPTMSDGDVTKWGTVVLPFELHSDSHVQYYELASVNETHTNMVFKPIETVSVGTPAVFCILDNSKMLSVQSDNAEVVNVSNEWIKEGCDWKMNGTFCNKNIVPLDLENANKRIYYISDDKFWYANEEFPVASFRGWFEVPSDISAITAKYNICIDGTTTGINATNNIEKTTKDIMYNLSGVRVYNPKKGEVNIINHKKIIAK